ncbi:MAG: twin-arginine translocase TatA/TatE family subunit [Proteobacteria bacterium]|nr:twin-arginine translocase TatA/TatE family subunit [Pseudomonadota bacterium]
MGNIGWWQILIVAVLVVLLFGRGKISDLMGDVAQGIKNFRKGMADDDADDEPSETAALLSGDDSAVEMNPKKDHAAKT